MHKAIFTGSFSPFHQGHLAIVTKAAKLFDLLYVVIAVNPEKEPSSLTFQNRKKYIESQTQKFANVKVDINEKEMTANYALRKNVHYLIRSARNTDDFQYELELAAANNHLNHQLETILIIPSYQDINFASRLMRQNLSKKDF